MSVIYSYKGLSDSVLDVDDKSRRVKNALNRVGILDSDKDIVEKGAFDKTIKENGPQGKNLIYHLTNHRADLQNVVGKFSELYMEGDFLVGVTDIPNTTWGNDVLEMYKSGIINQHSIGFSTLRREVMNDDDWEKRYTIIKEVKLFEASSVLWGANEETPNLSVGKSLTKEEKANAFKNWMNDFNAITKLLRSGNISDQSGELLQIKLKQLEAQISELFQAENSTQAADEAPAPEAKEDYDLIEKLMLLNIKTKILN